MLARLGVDNVYATAPERYPRPPLAELRAAGADLLVLPDEPYAFTADDGPEEFPGSAVRAGQRPSPDLVRPVPGGRAGGA